MYICFKGDAGLGTNAFWELHPTYHHESNAYIFVDE